MAAAAAAVWFGGGGSYTTALLLAGYSVWAARRRPFCVVRLAKIAVRARFECDGTRSAGFVCVACAHAARALVWGTGGQKCTVLPEPLLRSKAHTHGRTDGRNKHLSGVANAQAHGHKSRAPARGKHVSNIIAFG